MTEPSPQPEWLQRLLLEKQELSLKLEALLNFINTPPYHELKFPEQQLLHEQTRAMQAYQRCLTERLSLRTFKVDQEQIAQAFEEGGAVFMHPDDYDGLYRSLPEGQPEGSSIQVYSDRTGSVQPGDMLIVPLKNL